VLLPAAAISSLSILLAAGLSVLPMMDRLNFTISQLATQGKQVIFSKNLPDWAIWLAAVFFSFGLTFAIFNVPGSWRRVVLWLTTLFLIATWAPVLSLAAREPEIAVPFIAALWSGVCALVYTSKHRMPCDSVSQPVEVISPKKSDETR
jgi:FtsH-binding integral membrane protein